MVKYVNNAARLDAALEKKLKDQWLDAGDLIQQPNIAPLAGDADLAGVIVKANELINALVESGLIAEADGGDPGNGEPEEGQGEG